jgi:hypothetical protein
MGQRSSSISRVSATLASAIILMLASAASIAQGADLQGTWEYSRVNTKGEHYSGRIVIDGSGQASDTTTTPSGSVRQTGYIKVDGNDIDVIFKSVDASANRSGYSPDHFHCNVQSGQALKCWNMDTAGVSSYTFVMSRISGPPSASAPPPAAIACAVLGNPKPVVCPGISAAKDCKCMVVTNNCARGIIVQYSHVGHNTASGTLQLGPRQRDDVSVCTDTPTDSIQYNGWKFN